MSAERITIEPRNTVAQGPWEQPVRSALPVPLTDPRLDLTDQALVAASQNAFPIVATRKTRRDNLGRFRSSRPRTSDATASVWRLAARLHSCSVRRRSCR